MYGYFLLLMVGCYLQPVESTGRNYTCSFRKGTGYGGTIKQIGNQTGNDCVESCWRIKKSDNSIDGVMTFRRSSYRRGCWCYKNLKRIISSRVYRTCHLSSLFPDITFTIVRGDIPRGWRLPTSSEVKKYRNKVTPLIRDAFTAIKDECIQKTYRGFLISPLSCAALTSNRLVLKIPQCTSDERRSCHRRATCSKTIYTMSIPKCTCNSGFEGNGKTCQDINECLRPPQRGTCPRCTNTFGSFNCKCNTGYYWDGVNGCQDIDECSLSHRCDNFATCENYMGSYSCTCDNGYEGNGYTCTEKRPGKKTGISTTLVVICVVVAVIFSICFAVVKKVLINNRQPPSSSEATDHVEMEGRGSNISVHVTAPTAPPVDAGLPVDEEGFEPGYPKDSDLTGLSDGPPTYRGIYSSGYIPVTTDENLPPPPTYEEAIHST